MGSEIPPRSKVSCVLWYNLESRLQTLLDFERKPRTPLLPAQRVTERDICQVARRLQANVEFHPSQNLLLGRRQDVRPMRARNWMRRGMRRAIAIAATRQVMALAVHEPNNSPNSARLTTLFLGLRLADSGSTVRDALS